MIKFADMKENRLYMIILTLALVVPALGVVITGFMHGGHSVDFQAILTTWLRMVPFLLLFLIHNYLVAPLLVNRNKTAVYVLLAILLFAAFVVSQLVAPQGPPGGMMPPEPDFDVDFGPAPEDMTSWRPMHPAAMRVLMGLMVVGANLAIKYYFKGEEEKDRLHELERENLRYKLEYLRYQINPHFFMNTLNNIHALVDIDPEKAKDSIVELSKLMRHVLYDSDKPTIPLSQELDFLDNYISLMRLRYPESVRIEYQRPQSAEGVEVPPMSFATFAENAFKHGASYQNDCFIRISVSLEDDKVVFKCVNSRPAAGVQVAENEGIGIKNVKRRFELLYGPHYLLHVDDRADVYDIVVALPQKPDSK